MPIKWIITAIDSSRYNNTPSRTSVVNKYNKLLAEQNKNTRITTFTYTDRLNLLYDLERGDASSITDDDINQQGDTICFLDLLAEIFIMILKENVKEGSEISCNIYTNGNFDTNRKHNSKFVKDIFEALLIRYNIKVFVDEVLFLNEYGVETDITSVISDIKTPGLKLESSRSGSMRNLKSKHKVSDFFSISVRHR